MEETSGLKERGRKFPPWIVKKKGIRSNKDKTKINISFWSWRREEKGRRRRRKEKKRRKKEITGKEL